MTFMVLLGAFLGKIRVDFRRPRRRGQELGRQRHGERTQRGSLFLAARLATYGIGRKEEREGRGGGAYEIKGLFPSRRWPLRNGCKESIVSPSRWSGWWEERMRRKSRSGACQVWGAKNDDICAIFSPCWPNLPIVALTACLGSSATQSLCCTGRSILDALQICLRKCVRKMSSLSAFL